VEQLTRGCGQGESIRLRAYRFGSPVFYEKRIGYVKTNGERQTVSVNHAQRALRVHPNIDRMKEKAATS